MAKPKLNLCSYTELWQTHVWNWGRSASNRDFCKVGTVFDLSFLVTRIHNFKCSCCINLIFSSFITNSLLYLEVGLRLLLTPHFQMSLRYSLVLESLVTRVSSQKSQLARTHFSWGLYRLLFMVSLVKSGQKYCIWDTSIPLLYRLL